MQGPNIVVVGAGFAGVEAARGLERMLTPAKPESP